ncbi:hypothetical protein KBB96_12150 [Luteolibacter ambystomatis]|uniref:PKD domain-containing protein n=1 Tax=Luteolibacter ambystomatis TaxID=2824561 RepID=A0A975G5C4_9BACT|nr:hypothetical protein [Luteolibacter ambystomatis]QUE49624.1 hypothetical protein KBB96_12150 [Luteolibacter ambystomatis]
MKPRFSKILLPAVLAGLAVSALFVHQGRQNASSQGEGKAAAPRADVRSQHNSRASRDDDSKPDAVMSRLRVADKAALWEGVAWKGQNPAAFLDKKVGDEVSLDLGNGKPMSGKVFMSSPSPAGGTVVGIDFGQDGSTLHVRVEKNGSLFADLVPKDSLSSYRWNGTVSAPVFKRMAQTELFCSAIDEDEHGDAHIAKGMPPAPTASAGTAAASGGPQAVDPPKFNSRPGARGCIYLDFDGQVVTGSRWNSALEPTINALAPTYTEAEMTSICQVVAEDYAPFNVTVTTDEAVFNAAPSTRRMRVILTPSPLSFLLGTGGIALLGSWSDGSGDPCWVYTTGTGSVYGSALAASHEVGHTFGLLHDGLGTAEYYGTGNGAWGPIMGAPYGIPIVQFSNGDYTGATNFEDDLAIISGAVNGIGYMTDEYGNTPATASTLTKNSSGALAVNGLIATNTDIDYFTFSTTGGNCQINLKSPAAINPNATDLNISATLYDANGTVLLASNPAGAMTASVSQVLPAGTYRLSVEGAAEGTFDTGGYSKYGSIGTYAISGVIPGLGSGAVAITEPTVDGVSVREGHGVYLAAAAPGQNATTIIQWSQLSGPPSGTTTFSAPAALNTRAAFSRNGIYNLQLKVTTNGFSSTDTVQISVEGVNDVRNFSNLGPVLTVTSPTEFYDFVGNLSGAASDDGVPTSITPFIRWDVTSGAARIQNPAGVTTPITFSTPGAFKVSLTATDGQVRTYREFPINVAVRKIGAAVSTSAARMLVPTNGALGNTWTLPAFNDAAWTATKLALGYNTRNLYKTDLIGGADIRTALYNKGSNLFVRVPFTVRSVDYVTSMRLKMKFDDGFIMYLNGTEIIRRNAPAGVPAWNSTTIKRTAAQVATPLDIDLTSFKSALVNGSNVLAIQAINSKKNDTDFLLAPQFEVQIADTPFYRNLVENTLYPLSALTPTANADGDSENNLVEHALGRDPFAVTPATPYFVAVPGKAGTTDFTLPITPPNDVQYILERSYDGVVWTQLATKTGTGAWVSELVSITTLGLTPPTLTVRLVEASAPPTAIYRMRFVLTGPPLPP